MAQVPRARLLDLMKLRCQIFGTTFNPDGARTGGKILRQRLKGPAMASYYPPRGPELRHLFKEFKPLGLEGIDEEEEDRLEHIAEVRARGKGPPKKKRTPPPAKPGRK